MEAAEQLLKQRFNHSSFRSGQYHAIQHVLCPASPASPPQCAGRSLAIFPTGAGKSLCYQLPALLLRGLTLVVSPLMALMKDQVDALVKRQVSAAALDSSLTAAETRDLFDRLRADDVTILFVAPERFKNDRFLRLIRSLNVQLFVVDEAHCISEWGHSFRPDYLRLSRWADRLNCPRRLALTATATPKVSRDICDALAIPYDAVVRTPSVRPNLTTRVTHVPGPLESRVDVLARRLAERPPGPTIVYVTLQKTATLVADMLRKRGFLQAASYHAGMTQDARKTTQDDFMANMKDGLVVATIAFGMGMDHSSIRYVYHLNMPKSLESYIQEIGRAGRDGLDSICESFVSVEDIPTLEGFAYGETPTRSDVFGLVKDLFADAKVGGYIDFSAYNMGVKHDIRDTCLGQILAQLDLSENALEESTPFFAFIDVKMHPPNMQRWPPAGSEAAKLVSESQVKKLSMEVDVKKVAETYDWEYGKVARIADDLVHDGLMQSSKSRKMMQRAKVMKVPDDIEAVANRLHAMLLKSQRQSLNRVRQVIQFYSAKECQTKYLANHLGDELDLKGPCGHCEFCINDSTQPIKLLEEVDARKERVLDERRWALIELEDIRKQTPLSLARFAAGIWSPGMGRGIKKRHNFGSMCDHDFPVLLRAAEKTCGKKSE